MGTQPENTHGIQTQTQPNPYPNFGSGLGITLGYPNFGYPIPTIVCTTYHACTASFELISQYCLSHNSQVDPISNLAIVLHKKSFFLDLSICQPHQDCSVLYSGCRSCKACMNVYLRGTFGKSYFNACLSRDFENLA